MADLGLPPKAVRFLIRLGNYTYTHAWLFVTAPLLLDDFARGGLPLIEIIPISLLRGIGLAGSEHGWWCWGGSWIRWHNGKTWWDTGFAL